MPKHHEDADHDAFIAEIQAAPYDDIPRLIYADWLEERGDVRAEYLRLECEIADLRQADTLFVELQPRMAELRKLIDVRWLTAIGRTRINNCYTFTFQCPKRWERLRVTGEPRIRYCDVCQKPVHYCESIEQLKFHARRNDCVAIDSFLKHDPSDIVVEPPAESELLMGLIEMGDDDELLNFG